MTKEAFNKIAGGLNEALERVTLPASEETVPATDMPDPNIERDTDKRVAAARQMLANGIKMVGADEALNILVRDIMTALIEHIDDVEADLKCAVAIGRVAANQVETAREQAVRECAEIARNIATDLRNGGEARHQASILSSRILSLIPNGSDKP